VSPGPKVCVQEEAAEGREPFACDKLNV